MVFSPGFKVVKKWSMCIVALLRPPLVGIIKTLTIAGVESSRILATSMFQVNCLWFILEYCRAIALPGELNVELLNEIVVISL